MSSDELQTTINRMSLVFQQDADLAKAIKISDTHPAMAKVLFKMHESQRETERALNELRTNLIQLARLIEQITDTQISYQSALMNMAQSFGLGTDAITPDKEG